METSEHVSVGNETRLKKEMYQGNPYVNFDPDGTPLVDIQGIDDNGMPIAIKLNRIPVGVIVGMSGDYFGGREVEFDLPSNAEFKQSKKAENSEGTETLGQLLNKLPIPDAQAQKLINSYKRLANNKVTQSQLDTIFKIDGANYIPFSKTLNSYVQQLMFALRVKNYSEILNRNLSHFTPWSVRAYTISHFLALKYARIHYELKQLIANPEYQSDNEEFNIIHGFLESTVDGLTAAKLQDLAYRYQALSLGMEYFGFHYYTDHFAAGHGALVGDLRAILPQRFGTLGSILVNNLHDELNRVMVYTKKAYDPTPNPQDPPIQTGGDGDFDVPNNHFNKLACLAGMQSSLNDLHSVFNGGKSPQQPQYGGLESMPDIDNRYRQPQPLILLGDDNKVYYRTQLSQIHVMSPSQLKTTFADPVNHGYTELNNTWDAFSLVFKLRVLPFIYQGTLQTLTSTQLQTIEEEERLLNPGRLPVPVPQTVFIPPIPVSLPTWQIPSTTSVISEGLRRNSFLSAAVAGRNSPELVIDADSSMVPVI